MVDPLTSEEEPQDYSDPDLHATELVDPSTPAGASRPYERRGLYALAVSEVPSADAEGKRAASVWGVIWRVLVVVALLCAMTVVQAAYYYEVDTRNASPGLLGFAGVTWDTWWDPSSCWSCSRWAGWPQSSSPS